MKTINNDNMFGIPCDFDLKDSRTALKNTNVYNLSLDRSNLNGTTWYEMVFGGVFVQFKLFSSRHKSNILVAFDSPDNEQIEIFDGMKINRLFSRLYFKYTDGNQRNDSPIQILIGNFQDQIENETPLNGYSVIENDSLAAVGGTDTFDFYPNGKKVKITFHTTTALLSRNYDIQIQTFEPTIAVWWTPFQQNELMQDRMQFEMNMNLNERLRFVLTNNHGAVALAYFIQVEVM